MRGVGVERFDKPGGFLVVMIVTSIPMYLTFCAPASTTRCISHSTSLARREAIRQIRDAWRLRDDQYTTTAQQKHCAYAWIAPVCNTSPLAIQDSRFREIGHFEAMAGGSQQSADRYVGVERKGGQSIIRKRTSEVRSLF